MSIDSALSIANSSLANISQQMALISHNVANASTPGYATEVATQTSVTAGGLGSGVHQGPVTRDINLQLQSEVQQQNATVSGLQTQVTLLQPIDAAQGTPGQGSDLASQLGTLHDAFVTLQGDPSSAASQGQVITAASNLATQINTLSNTTQTARQNAQNDLQTNIGTLNTTLATLSSLSDQIVAGLQAGQSVADLQNQRDAAMATMSSLVNVKFITQPNGAMLAATSGGLALQLTSPPPQFSVQQSAANAQTYYPGGGIAPVLLNGQDVTKSLTGGQIGADITLRDTTLPTYQGELDEFANTLSSRFSAQGLNLFTAPSPTASAIVPPPTQSGYLGYAATIAVNPTILTTPTDVRDGTTAIAGSPTGASAFTPNPAGGPASFTTLIDRVINYSFGSQVQPNVTQPPPATSGLGPQGTLTAPFGTPSDLSDFATSLVTSQSTDISNAQSQLATQQTVQSTLQSQVTATSGVSTDTQLSNMVVLQNSYGATGRIIAAVQSMWTQLLAMVPV